jgi:hypothetical protein
VYILEVPPGILCIIRSKSWDFVHFWKILVEFCAKCTQSHEELSNIHNPTRNFEKCTKSNEELPKMHKIPQETSKNAQNPRRNFQICTKSYEDLPKMHKIS